MSNLKAKAKDSKLQRSFKTQERIVATIRPKEVPRSYRLEPEIMNILKDTLNSLNEITTKKVTESRLIKALIVMSQEIKREDLIKAIKQVF